MLVIDHKEELKATVRGHRAKNRSIGFVPTMGALHEGHLALVNKAITLNDVVVVSIFINPTQFDNKEDLEKYPRTLQQDIALLESISKNVLLFTPSKENMYNGKVVSRSYNFNGLEKVMEGTHRAGHFDGVATIVELLLDAVTPDNAFFGEKDFQQLQIIKKLVEIKKLPYQIIGCPIARETNGLARSSRNERLPTATREEAGFIYKTLTTAKTKFGTESALVIKDWVKNEFEKSPYFDLEYFEIADTDTLTPILKKQRNKTYRAFIAVYAENIRLIDNIALN